MDKDYKKLYEKLKKYVINLHPYCNNCKNQETERGCDECNRKSFYWSINPGIIESMEEE